MKRRHRPVALPGKLVKPRPAAPPVTRSLPVPSMDEVVAERFPQLGYLRRAILADEDWLMDVELRVYQRHRPIFDHGRSSAEVVEDWPGGCPDPQNCGHLERALVCGTCRDFAGDVLEAPCAELVDLGLRHGADVG